MRKISTHKIEVVAIAKRNREKISFPKIVSDGEASQKRLFWEKKKFL